MRLAVLGFDESTLRLVRWAIGKAGHELIAAVAQGASGGEFVSLAPGVRRSEDWEDLLSLTSLDAVLVAAANPQASGDSQDDFSQRGEQLRRLTQAGVPLLVVSPACEAIVGFEIEMIRRDTGAVVVPYSPGEWHPAIKHLATIAASGESGPIGTIEQIVLERELQDRSRGTVQTQLVRDLAIVRLIIGQVQTVTATGPARPIGRDPMGPKPKELPALNNLAVVLGGNEGLTARWSVVPGITEGLARVTVSGQRGKAVLTMPARGEWSLDIAGDQFASQSFPEDAEIERVFAELSRAGEPGGTVNASSWLAACRDQEAAEAVDRSLARGRTIELFHEEHSEAASFKGIMAMGGCLLLLLALCVLLLMSVIDGLQLPLRNLQGFRAWPLYLLVPIGGFLLLQLLGLAAKRPLTPQAPDAARDVPQQG